MQIGVLQQPVRLLERRLRDTPRGLSLIAALCKVGSDNPSLRAKLFPTLDLLRQTTVQPSSELLLALAWTQLTGAVLDSDKCRMYLRQVLDRTSAQTLIPPAEAGTPQQVRAAYQQLAQGSKREDIVQYLSRVIETKEAERSEQSHRNLERNIGVELAARECLIEKYSLQGMRREAIQMLDSCDRLLVANADTISPGLIAKEWHELSKVSSKLGLTFAALRFINHGLKADTESNELKGERLRIETLVPQDETELLNGSMARLAAPCRDAAALPLVALDMLCSSFETFDLLKLRAPLTHKALGELLISLKATGEGAFETEETADLIDLFGKAELPANAVQDLGIVLSWLVKVFAKEQPRNPLDVEIHDERAWPRSYETQLCSLLVLNAVTPDGCEANVFEPGSGECLWQGHIPFGKPLYKRWIIEREDGFVADEPVDVPLRVQVSTPTGYPEYTLTISTSVASSEAVWPDYPTGALDPKDVQGGELYGRSGFIKRIVSSFGQARVQATYLIEGVRQMGKTSLLKFIKQNAPKHVLPVYVNLEAIQSDPERNVWNTIIEQVLRDDEVAQHATIAGPIQRKRHGDLVALARELCAASGKAYLLLLMDELHVLLRESDNPKGVLADFRTDLNEGSNRISLLLADRYTLQESERKVESEYWLQLTPEALDPLDYASTQLAIEVPCQGSDIRFLPDAILRVYHWTCGYPFHVQRLVQNVLAKNLEGPWVTVMPGDIDGAIPGLLHQDRLFQEGLCRKDRMDSELQAAIAAVLEWSDLTELFSGTIGRTRMA